MLIGRRSGLLTSLLKDSRGSTLRALKDNLFHFVLSVGLFPPIRRRVGLPHGINRFRMFY